MAAVVLRDPVAHEDATYTLTGSEAVTLTEATARLSVVLGSIFSFTDRTPEEACASCRQWSQEQWQLDAWVSTCAAICDGEVAEVTDHVARLTGHPASPLELGVRS